MPRPRLPHLEPTDDYRAIERTPTVIGGKWAVPIIHALLGGTRRFNQVLAAVHGARPKQVSARLRDFERRGLVTRTPYREVPPRVEYALTDAGRTLRPIIEAMVAWGAAQSGDHDEGE